MQDRLIINLCPTGMIPRKATAPFVPEDPKEIAEDVRRCRDAGASIVHVHARDEQGEPTWRPQRFRETLDAIRDVCADIILVVTTSGRNWSEVDKRAAALDVDGVGRPEMASLTLGSMNFPKSVSVNAPETIRELVGRMQERGITPELEVFDVGMANFARFLIDGEVLRPPFYFNVLLGSLGTADLSAANLAAVLAALPADATWALAGIGRYQLQANTLAIALGGHVRVGIEDNPYLDWRTREHARNPQLVERVVRIAREHGRVPAEPAEARALIGLPPLEARA